MGVISGDRGGQGVGPTLPVHLFGNVASKNRQTCEPQCGDAPSCCKIEHVNPSVEMHHLVVKLSTAETLLTEVQRKVPTCLGKHFVCNQGKTLCSPCISRIPNLVSQYDDN